MKSKSFVRAGFALLSMTPGASAGAVLLDTGADSFPLAVKGNASGHVDLRWPARLQRSTCKMVYVLQ